MRCRPTSCARATGSRATTPSRPPESIVRRTRMTIDQIRDALPDYARDLKLNLGSVLTTTGAPGLNEKQVWSIALASAIAARNTAFARHIEALAKQKLADVEVEGAKAAAAIMGMNNIYYRFLHLVEDNEYQSMP